MPQGRPNLPLTGSAPRDLHLRGRHCYHGLRPRLTPRDARDSAYCAPRRARGCWDSNDGRPNELHGLRPRLTLGG
eukprot:10191288-Lingulodinium_polyedra.AAC.1